MTGTLTVHCACGLMHPTCLSNDPVGFVESGYNPQMFNRYSYVYNDPTNQTDPTGQCPWCLAGALIGAAIETGSQLAANGGDVSKLNVGEIAVAAATGAVGGGAVGAVAKAAVRQVAKTGAKQAAKGSGRSASQQSSRNLSSNENGRPPVEWGTGKPGRGSSVTNGIANGGTVGSFSGALTGGYVGYQHNGLEGAVVGVVAGAAGGSVLGGLAGGIAGGGAPIAGGVGGAAASFGLLRVTEHGLEQTFPIDEDLE